MRNLGDYWNWMTTPSWWTNLTMNRPQRRKAATWQKNAAKTEIKDLEELDTPSVSKKPHHYFW